MSVCQFCGQWEDRCHCDKHTRALLKESEAKDARIAALTAELLRFQTFQCGHVAADDIKWDGCPICAMKVGTAERISALEAENERLREMLWMRHGCDISALYGDDGEMQCGRCIIDFRRDPAEQIQQRFRHLGQLQAAAIDAALGRQA